MPQNLADEISYEGKAYWLDDIQPSGFRLHADSKSKVYFVHYRINGKENLLKIGGIRKARRMGGARKKLTDIVSSGIALGETKGKQNALMLSNIITQYESICNSYSQEL